MKPFEHNNKENFIAGWYINTDLCDKIIESYKNLQLQGKEHGIKDSITDYYSISLFDIAYEIKESYLQELLKVTEKYKEKYKWCSEDQNFWTITTPPNIQRYEPNHNYKIWHCEDNGFASCFHRHLVFMTYLNDIEQDGETEFFYQSLKIKPKKGLTIIWPSAWTHTHRGIAAPYEEKFIVTGWFSYDIYQWKHPADEK